MCRNIRKLRRPNEAPTDGELREAALQFIRKVSGYRIPSEANQATFDEAVASVTSATRHLFDNLVPSRYQIPAKSKSAKVVGR